MADADIPFPLSSAPGRSPPESAGRLVNCFAEALERKSGSSAVKPTVYGGEAKAGAVHRRVPGLPVFSTAANLSDTGCRGFLEVNGALYSVIGQHLYLFSSDGSQVTVGAVAGTKKVFMARNNKVPNPDKVMVTENGAFTFTDVAVSAYPDNDLPVPISVTFQDGYFIFPIGDGRVFSSDLNDTAINSLAFVKAESKPDGLFRAIAFNNQILLLGQNSTEFWIDTANTAPAFPYSRSTSIPRGLVSTTAIAGHEDGFGGAALIWVADHNRVVKLNGYGTDDISPPDLDRLIESVADKTTLEASVYVASGAPRWVLSSNTWSWEFNLNSQKWNERESYGLTRWRGTQGVWAFGKWIVGDTQSGALFTVDSSFAGEGSNRLRYFIESGPVQDFPHRTRIARIDFDFDTGVGNAAGTGTPETDPVVEISWSDDGGTNWSQPVFRPLGQQGRTDTRVTVNNVGQSGPRGRRWRLAVSDDVYAALIRGSQSTSLRRA